MKRVSSIGCNAQTHKKAYVLKHERMSERVMAESSAATQRSAVAAADDDDHDDDDGGIECGARARSM